MKELAAACREAGLGFGFYYSHNQDWTFPGGNGGPTKDENGDAATFDDYLANKCLPQVNEITTEYGPIEIVWFDTPGDMPKDYVEQLVELVHKNQPRALVPALGRTNYAACLGDSTWQTMVGPWDSDLEEPVATARFTRARAGHRGFFKPRDDTGRFRDCLDGLANTIAMGEITTYLGDKDVRAVLPAV